MVTGDLPQLCECRVFVRKREAINAPSFGVRIDFRSLDKPAVDVKSISAANTDHLVTDTGICEARPGLFVDRPRTFPSNLAIIEPVTLEVGL
jgi:hypothetical protein